MSRYNPRGLAGARGVGLALALALAGGPACADTGGDAPAVAASTILNKSDRSWTFTIIASGTRTEHALSPGGVLKGVCSGGCIVVLEGAEDGSYVLEGNERVAIEDGVIYYDDAARQGERLVPGAP